MTLVVVNNAANTSSASFQIQNRAATTPDAATFTNTTSNTTTISLTGTLNVGETWYLQVQIPVTGSTVTRTYVHTVVASDTLATIASSLADAVNNDVITRKVGTQDVVVANFTVLVSGNRIVLVNRSGETYSANVGVAAAGSESTIALALTGTLTTGQVWSVQVAGLTFFHSVIAGDTLAVIAADLATKINASTTAGATATASGNTLSVRVVAGAVTLAGNTSASSMAISLVGAPVVGQQWRSVPIHRRRWSKHQSGRRRTSCRDRSCVWSEHDIERQQADDHGCDFSASRHVRHCGHYHTDAEYREGGVDRNSRSSRNLDAHAERRFVDQLQLHGAGR